jgi:hypothetical protein
MSPGGQNFTACCVKALDLFRQHGNTSSIVVSSSFHPPTSQYPCGATWQGDPTGAPPVKVSYTWCNQQCPGWQLSSSQKLNQWLQPFVGFIVPAVIFSLNVPRRRKLSLPDFVFPAEIFKNPVTLLVACVCAIIAAMIVAIDTILWLCAVFALAGPLLLSGLYEAWIDKRVLDFVSEKIENEHLELATRARILLTVLVGNLDLDFAWAPTMDVTRHLENPSPMAAANKPLSTPDHSSQELYARGALISPVDPNLGAPHSVSPPSTTDHRQESTDATSAATSETTAIVRDSAGSPGLTATIPQEMIHDVKTRLKSMLACQYSFGSTVGAPVVFYIGSFIYAVLEIRSLLGDNDTSHALAFGMWWSSIPHIAIVSGCLLAGNNPNTLAGITPPRGRLHRVLGRQNLWSTLTEPLLGVTDRVVGLTYDAMYKPAWMWNRGRSKREWLLRLCEEFRGHDRQDFLPALEAQISMGWLDWLTVSVFAFLLFFIPCLFGFLTSFYTPQIGLSCRSLTFVMYGSAQTWLLLLWIWNLTWRDNNWRARRRGVEVYARADRQLSHMPTAAADPSSRESKDVIVPIIHVDGASTEHETRSSLLTQAGDPSPLPANSEPNASTEQASRINFGEIFSSLSEARWFQSSPNQGPSSDEDRALAQGPAPSISGISRLGFIIFWFLMAIGFAAAVFSSIGGTMMQIMGVYRNCLCQINVNTWLHGRQEATLQLSTNSAEDIQQASKYWIPMGGAASAFLGLVAYVAWWYQRRLRFHFTELVGRIDRGLPPNGPNNAALTG